MRYSFGFMSVALVGLSACGGGGGSNAGLALLTLPGGTLSGLTANGLTTSVSVTTDENGDGVLASTSGLNRSQLSTNEAGDLLRDGQVIGQQFDVEGESTFALEHSTFGVWGSPTASGANVDLASFGDVTSPGALPTGDATYRGASIGLSQDAYYDSSFVTASEIEVRITDNLRRASIESRNTVISDVNSSNTFADSSYDFSGSGSVSGSGFSADIANEAYEGFNISGVAQGNFYGPTGEEVGGVFSMSGGGSVYKGAFGASR